MNGVRLILLLWLGFGQPAVAETARLMGSIGVHQETPSSAEAYIRYLGEPCFWKLQPVLGLSVAQHGAAWVGAGAAVTFRVHHGGLFLRLSSMAGLHARGSGKDLGGPIQFRTALDIGFKTSSGVEFGIGGDHRSSALIYRPNPGLNTGYLFASIPLR